MSGASKTKRVVVVAGACALAAVEQGTGQGMLDIPGDKIPNSYIVVLRDTTTPDAVASTANALVQQYGGQVKNVYDSTLTGFSAQASREQAEKMAKDPRVKFVEPNQRIHVSG